MPVVTWWMCAVLAVLAVPAYGDTGQEPVAVEWHHGRLSVHAEGVPFSALLAAIAQKTGVEVRGLGTLPERASIHFVNLPLHEGLKILLNHHNYAIIEVPAAPGRPGHLKVVLLGHPSDAMPETSTAPEPGSAPLSSESEPDESTISAQELERQAVQGDVQALRRAATLGEPTTQGLALQYLAQQDADAATRVAADTLQSTEVARRVQAVQMLGELDNPAATAALGTALQDPDLGTRYAAVTGLIGHTSPVAVEFLTQALQDHDASIRRLALELLAQKGVAGQSGVSIALSDSEPAIRARAQEVLAQMEAAE